MVGALVEAPRKEAGHGMRQTSLFDVGKGLTCSFGEPWTGAHPLCEQESERLCAAFAEAVARGEFDAAGYSPADRKAQAKRRTELAR
jgi:hypothetical protein